MADTAKTPEMLAKEAAEKEQAKAAREKFLNEVKTAINSAPDNPNVRVVLRYVMGLSGFMLNPVAVGSNGDIMVSSTVYNAGRESVYHDLRKAMSAETKNIVERSEA